MAIIHKPEKSTITKPLSLIELRKKIYDKDEIKEFDLRDAINNNPLAKQMTTFRSKLAYSEILKELKPTKRYLLPGQIVLFHYNEPKYKEELEYYDMSPLTLFCGITRIKNGNIREVGFNLHYYPPFTRARVLEIVYNHFKPYFIDNFNESTGQPNVWLSYSDIKHLMKVNMKIGFGVKMYIPTLRDASYVVPTRLLSTAFYTEGHFSKATLTQIQRFWRQYRK